MTSWIKNIPGRFWPILACTLRHFIWGMSMAWKRMRGRVEDSGVYALGLGWEWHSFIVRASPETSTAHERIESISVPVWLWLTGPSHLGF